jgi:hypothetical protein
MPEMGQKDVVEKILEEYDDVFADIVNVLLFDGRQVIDPSELEAASHVSAYKADGKIRGLERDVAKYWKKQNIRIAFVGFENQTKEDRLMPMRVLSYDGSEYRRQYSDTNNGGSVYPVVTLVLYFGEKRWKAPRNVCGVLDIPEEFKPFVSDYRMNLFEIGYLSDEQVKMFKSDFGVVADYFVQTVRNGEYVPNPQTLDHVQAVLQALSVFTKDDSFEKAYNDSRQGERVRNMCEVVEKFKREGYERAKQEDKQEMKNKFAGIAADLREEGLSEEKIRKILGENYDKNIL